MSTTTPRAVLVGAPGAGKTSVGRLLAQRWGVEFRDTDHDIEVTTGQDVADIFVVHGESYFRELERAAVAAALSEHTGVLALGGGAVVDEATRELLAGHTVVFLDVTLTDAAARVGFNRDRPLLVGNVRARLKALLDERRPLYEAVAVLSVSTEGRTPAEVVEVVSDELAARTQEEA